MEDIKKFDEILRSYQSTQVINRGIGPLSLLGIALVVLKAMGYISISWVWALAPFWIPLIFSAIIVVLILCAITGIVFCNKVSVEVIKEANSESVNTDSTTTEEEQSTQKTPVVEEQVQVKPKKKRPKKKKEESNNGEQKEEVITGTETSTNK